MAFTTTTGANGVVSLVGTSGVDADLAIIYSSNVFIDGKEANDSIGFATELGQGFVTEYTVIGGLGNDFITSGDDSLVNGAIWGDDITTDADGNQVASAGEDIIRLATVQNSTVLGLGGIDQISTGITQGSDINGNEGSDQLTIGSAVTVQTISDNFIRGGKGTDIITVNSGLLLNNHINGNKDGDQITVTVDGTSVITSTVYGGQGNDAITLNATGADLAGFTAFGDLGDDKITASARKDTIDGGEGNDTLDGGDGADKITGGLGKDTFNQITDASVARTKLGTNPLEQEVWTFGDGVDVITDSTTDDIINFDTVQIYSNDEGLTVGVWNDTAMTFTVNAFGSDYFFGDPTSISGFVIIGSIAAAPAAPAAPAA